MAKLPYVSTQIDNNTVCKCFSANPRGRYSISANGQLSRKAKVVREPKSFRGHGNTVGKYIDPFLSSLQELMIGIYKITNKLNGKAYIGQSVNIERRFKEHCSKTGLVIEAAIAKYGTDNFTFEVLEECPKELLNEREVYYIELFDTYNNGYNCHIGGNSFSGEKNNNAKLTEADVYEIREAYRKHLRRKDVYE